MSNYICFHTSVAIVLAVSITQPYSLLLNVKVSYSFRTPLKLLNHVTCLSVLVLIYVSEQKYAVRVSPTDEHPTTNFDNTQV